MWKGRPRYKDTYDPTTTGVKTKDTKRNDDMIAKDIKIKINQ